MLYIGLQNYDHFKELFSKRETRDGKMVRQNRILLSYYKNAIKNHRLYPEAKQITNMTGLYNKVIRRIESESLDTCMKNLRGFCCSLLDYKFASPDYRLDNKGLCVDGDASAIRYERIEDNKIFKMKAGKFLNKIALNTEYGQKLDQPTLGYILETFSQKWFGYASEFVSDYTLEVDDNFRRIYSSRYYADNSFHSCMTDNGQYEFYENAVNASAASIWKDGKMYARCIVWNKVYDEDGNIYRLAERQYSAGENELYKHILVNMLIKEGYIDGYKKIGAGCHDADAFIDIKGQDLSHKTFSIDCEVYEGDTISYQDSFKYFNQGKSIAYNNDDEYYDYDLATTDSRLGGGSEWDEYHEEYCDEIRHVYVWSERRHEWDESTCDVDRLDDFICCEDGEYYERDYVVEISNGFYPHNECIYCTHIDESVLEEDAVWSEYHESYLPIEDAVKSKYHDSWLYEPDAIYSEDADDYFGTNSDLAEWAEKNLTEEEEEETAEELDPVLA